MENGRNKKEQSSNEIFGNLVKKYREAEGISQEDLASDIGISQVYLSKIENGKANITFDIAESFSKKLPRLAFREAVKQLTKKDNDSD